MDQNSPIFAIAMAAELSGLHPQTLRQYDRLGLVSPKRTVGKSRRYSLHDVNQLKMVAQLSAQGITLDAIRHVFGLEEQIVELQDRVRQLEGALAAELLKSPGRRVFAAGLGGDVVSLKRGTRTQRRNELQIWSPNRIFRGDDN